MKTLLIIAGSDSGGGAGIQADIKTAAAHGVFATTAITALTAQNTLGVLGVADSAPAFVVSQIKAVLSDIGADAVKIGMLSNSAIIKAVHESLCRLRCPIVLDTVMLAKGGAPLLQKDATNALKTLLLPMATIVTPNIPEAEVLSGIKITDTATMQEAGQKILALGARAVLVKGGHLESERVIDLLVTPEKAQEFMHPRINSKNTHGTGCTLASAIASNLAKGSELAEAIGKAADYVHRAILAAPKIGGGHGPLNHNVEA